MYKLDLEKAGLEEGLDSSGFRGSRDQIANIHWIMEKTKRVPEKIYFCFTDYAKAFDCGDHNKLENS